MPSEKSQTNIATTIPSTMVNFLPVDVRFEFMLQKY